ncbi:GAF domain-containing protein [Oscillatoria sp. CS-180]|uniref:GAF domain-containing protein n=1 Tax=Oscillatoria sp. CS-180 TaxID=3021720 RepID=UPI00232B57DE|nr:GAF domain-containing protein [Oscillatoria sp. CS-180]MDB9529903.1 GAF domain-containing protein [Oscillatoria sp. CS-180]
MTYEPVDQSDYTNINGQLPPSSPQSDIPSWWSVLERHSRLLVAAVDLRSHRIEWTSKRFRHLVGMTDTPPTLGDSVLQRLSSDDQLWLRERIRRHVLNAIIAEHYDQEGLLPSRWLHEPLIISVKPLEGDRARFVEFTVSSDHIHLLSLDPAVKSAFDDCWQELPNAKTVIQQLNHPHAPLQRALQLLNPQTYQASGTILLEGMDVSDREVTQRLIHILLDRESILQPQRFRQANELLKRLFRATDSLILTAEGETAVLYTGLGDAEWTTHTLSFESLQESSLFRLAAKGSVVNLRDLSNQCPSIVQAELCQKRGAKSLLVLPLVATSAHLKSSSQLLGFVGLVSNQYDAFGAIDEHHGKTLAPALAIAMRQSVNERFTHIHESVRWRFEEEAERRSLGLPPAPITFGDVYPLYGISDIRGSSQERNRAIQQDLLTQFRLGLKIGEAVCQSIGTAFACQLRDDLLEKIEQLQQGVTVDAEITLLRYLRDNLENHFSFFKACGEAVEAAIATYESAKDPDQGCVYAARAVYDQTIQHINLTLKSTWHRWQRTMQAVSPHYCDVEATDGIDHMIYAGGAIDKNFSPFHLRSLRYEQLRAVCDCARTGFRLKAEYQTDMEITHLVLVQDYTVDITHDENTERLFEVRGTRDTRYEIVKKRIDKALDAKTQDRITQPGYLTLVYSTLEEWKEYQEYLRYLQREGWVGHDIETGHVEPLQGVTGLKFVRVQVLDA